MDMLWASGEGVAGGWTTFVQNVNNGKGMKFVQCDCFFFRVWTMTGWISFVIH